MTVSNPTHSPSTNVEAQSELQEYTAINKQRRRLLPRAALVGLCSGLVASLFRLMLAGADTMRNALLNWAHQFPVFGIVFPVLLGITGAVVSVLLVRNFAPDAKGSGIPHLKAVLHRYRTMYWKRVLPVKFVAGVLALGSGMTLGREGPSVQLGGAVGDAIAKWLKAAPREHRTLMAAGAGAGLAAAFNAPLSGLTFVLEEVQRDFHPIVFAAAFVASIVADIVARLLAGSASVFVVPPYAAPPIAALPLFALLGIAAGIFGVLFNRGLIGMLNLFARLGSRAKWTAAALVGMMIGTAGWFSPAAVGGGHALAEMALAGHLALVAIPLWFALRFLLTTASYGTGAAGGIFAPLLVLGALIGLGVGQIGNALAPAVVPEPGVFAVVGMAAYFTAIVRAPLTGILLIVEMTGSYEQMLPLLISCFCAYAVAEWLKALPIYEALLERDLTREDQVYNLREPIVLDFEVEPGALFEGKEVRALGLPPGCVLVRCQAGGREFVPTAFTRLEAYMKLTAIIAPEAAASLQTLRTGCKTQPVHSDGAGEMQG